MDDCCDTSPLKGHRTGTQESGSVHIALIGSPNAGKTSLFNALTGLNAKTGNYPGVTVCRNVGQIVLPTTSYPTPPHHLHLEDLPGTYSLDPISPDEQVVSDLLLGTLGDIARPDALLLVVDSTTLSRSLNLVAQALDQDLPTALVLTMGDELEHRGGSLTIDDLSAALGIPVISVIGNRRRGLDNLYQLVAHPEKWQRCPFPPPTEPGPERDSWNHSMLVAAHYQAPHTNLTTARIDRVLLHPVWGSILFFLIMFGFFQLIFTVAAPFQEAIETCFAWLGNLAGTHIHQPLLSNFVTNALIGGVGNVLVFVPQILLMFLLISLMENVGYISRAAFLMDKVMTKSGLEGRAFVAMLSSLACAVPGIMATRTLPNSRDRIATAITVPLMTCSARLPVYLLLTGMLINSNSRIGPLSLQGLAMFGLYLLGGISTMVAAYIAKHTAPRSGLLPFYMEMPPYRLPTLRSVLRDMWQSTRVFLIKIGKIILVASVVLWALLTIPLHPTNDHPTNESQAAHFAIENSVAAGIGKAIEPVFAPLGFDWRINIGLMGSMAAREVFVATMGQVAAAEDPDNPAHALAAMTYTHGPHQGEKVFTPPTTVALLVFFAYALQCMATIGALRRETNSWKWPLISFTYMLILAWIMAFLARGLTLLIMG